MTHDWLFEPCENEGPVCDMTGTPWAHAVRGRKPQRPTVYGYGHTEAAADFSAREKAAQQDAREVLGQRGEVVTQFQIESPAGTTVQLVSVCRTWQIVDSETGDVIVNHLERYFEPITYRLSMGAVWPIYEMPFMPIGT